MTGSIHGSRRRGVRASRVKLHKALADAGLKTQAALAERIADVERLESAPLHLVNRVFREKPVDPQTIERVARALEVNAASLYRSTHDPRPASDGSGRGPGRAAAPGWQYLLAALLVLGAAVLILGGRDDSPEPIVAADPVTPSPSELDLGALSVLVLDFTGPAGDIVSRHLRAHLAERYSVASEAALLLSGELGSAEAGQRLRVNLVVDGEIVEVGRLAGVRAHLQAGGVRRQIWGETLPAVLLNAEGEAIGRRIAAAVQAAGGDVLPSAIGHFAPAPVQDDYLQGRLFLDQAASELNLKRAQARFAAALRQDADYARAHAGLCEALLEEHWMDDEERVLRDAAGACGQALSLAPQDPVVRAAHAHFLRLTGRLDEALEVYADIVAGYPQDAAILAAQAFTLLQHFRASGDPRQLELAMEVAAAAMAADPGFWKGPFFLANMRFFSGDLDGAIEAAAEARARNENEMVLANLGSFQFCRGDLEAARDAYLRAGELAPHSYVGDEFLGMVHHYLGDFEEAVRLRRKAISSVAGGSPEMHEMWGNLADSKRLGGGARPAVEVYRKAIEIVERDLLRGTGTGADRAARAWYYLALEDLSGQPLPTPVAGEILADLEALEPTGLEPTAGLRLAMAWLLRGEEQRAAHAMAAAAGTCGVFARAPGLEPLRRADVTGASSSG